MWEIGISEAIVVSNYASLSVVLSLYTVSHLAIQYGQKILSLDILEIFPNFYIILIV